MIDRKRLADLEKLLSYARWLLANGAPASAAEVLRGLRGGDVGKVQRECQRMVAQPGIFALLVATVSYGGVAKKIGVAARVPARIGRWHPIDPAMREGYEVVMSLASHHLGTDLPYLKFEFSSMVDAAGGPSFSLPALLSVIAHYVPSRSPHKPVFATGQVGPSGAILPVGGMNEKIEAAQREKCPCLILVPPGTNIEGTTCVETVEQAIRLVFGAAPLTPDQAVLGLNRLIDDVRKMRDWEAALDRLQIPEAKLQPADLARLKFEQGAILLHLGRTEDASRLHAQAAQLLGEPARLAIGRERAEHYDLFPILAAMDRFEIDDAIAALEALVRQPFQSYANKLRYQGALAQAYGMRGDYADAVRMRTRNLALHPETDELAAMEAGTRCCLAVDSARAGFARDFDEHAQRLGALSPQSDAHQATFNASATIRGLVALGEHARAVAFASGAEAFGWYAPENVQALVHGTAPISTHPDVSTARALCRAYRRLGEPDRAIAIADRACTSDDTAGGLVRWVVELLALEGTLARAEPEALQSEIRARMQRWHPAASAFHASLMTATASDLEIALSGVWY
ncbi:MAG: S16 family serine protease [Polyangiales bacterium]